MRKMNAIKFIKSRWRVFKHEKKEPEWVMDAETLCGLGIALIFAGIIVTLIAVVLLFISSVGEKGKVKGGGAIIIGPFPIIFGTDKESVRTVLLLSLALTAFLVIMIVIFYVVSK